MSEVTPTPEELVENISLTVEDSEVVPMPIDPTLSIEGEAADAKATGDAIAAVIGDLRINGKAPSSNAVTLYGTDIALTNAAGAQTVNAAISALSDKDASDIMYDPTNLVTIKAALDDIYTSIDSELSDESIDTIFESVFGGEE